MCDVLKLKFVGYNLYLFKIRILLKFSINKIILFGGV